MARNWLTKQREWNVVVELADCRLTYRLSTTFSQKSTNWRTLILYENRYNVIFACR